MLRALAILVFVVVAAVAVAWRFDVLPGLGGTREPPTPPVPALLAAINGGDLEGLRVALAGGASLQVVDDTGRPPLALAVELGQVEAAEALLRAGAMVDAVGPGGVTPLMTALKGSRDARMPLLLLNAGANPTLLDAAGQGVMDYLRANPSLRASVLALRVQEVAERPFTVGWPSLYVAPVVDATLSSRAAHWPGARRAYRNGVHEGFDFYAGAVSGSANITFGTPIVALADGIVVRADRDYVEMDRATYDAIINEAQRSLSTPPHVLDKLRGQQVWIEHAGGFISRYAHLSSIPGDVLVGGRVVQGQVIGGTGNSGTIDGVLGTRDDPHPHVEIWRGDMFMGQGLEPQAIFELAGQVFGQRAMPPRWGP
jgi:murein DD-endopeptidase MepM/ murein hydrolase activator NlpD